MIAAIRHLYDQLGRFPLSPIELALRIGVGMVFFKSALTKLDDEWMVSSTAVALFAEEYKVPVLSPALAAHLGTAVEFFGAILVMIGLASRPAAAALLALTAVIQFTVYPGNWAEHLLWAGPLAYVLTRGPGAISLDHLLAGRIAPVATARHA
jgi:putative oxidoreductase